MTTTLIEAVATAVDTGSALTAGTDLFVGWMPDQPDTCISLHEYDGEAPDYVLGSPVVEKPRIQVMSRSYSYATARDMLATIRGLVDVTTVTLSGVQVLRLAPNGTINALGKDDKDRWMFSLSLLGTVMR